jgi:hypothetical protein
MYLVSPDYLNTVTSNNSNTTPPLPPDTVRKASKAGEKHNSSKRRSVKKIKKRYTPKCGHDRWVAKRSAVRRDYDKWFKVRAKLLEADVERRSQIKTVADYLKQVLPASPSSQRDASHSGTQKEHRPTKWNIKSEVPPPPAIPAKRRIAYKTTTLIPSTSSEVVYEASTPQTSIKRDDNDDDDVSTDDQRFELQVIDYGAMTVGALASPFVSPYLYESKRRDLDTECGIEETLTGS